MDSAAVTMTLLSLDSTAALQLGSDQLQQYQTPCRIAGEPFTTVFFVNTLVGWTRAALGAALQ